MSLAAAEQWFYRFPGCGTVCFALDDTKQRQKVVARSSGMAVFSFSYEVHLVLHDAMLIDSKKWMPMTYKWSLHHFYRQDSSQLTRSNANRSRELQATTTLTSSPTLPVKTAHHARTSLLAVYSLFTGTKRETKIYTLFTSAKLLAFRLIRKYCPFTC